MPIHHGLLFYLSAALVVYAGVAAIGHGWGWASRRVSPRWTVAAIVAALVAADVSSGFAADRGYSPGMYLFSVLLAGGCLALLFRPPSVTFPQRAAAWLSHALKRAASRVAPGPPHPVTPSAVVVFTLLAAGAALAGLKVFADAPFPVGDSLVQINAITQEMRSVPLAGLLTGTQPWPQDGFGLFNLLVMKLCGSQDHLSLFVTGRLLSLGCMIVVAGVTYFAAYRRFGLPAAALGTGCLLFIHHFYLYRLIEDFLFILLLLANMGLMGRVMDRKGLWWLAGLAAGLCVYTKATGVLLLPAFAILAACRHGRGVLWSRHFAAYAALFTLFLVPTLLQLHLHGAKEQGLSLFHLLYFKPAAFDYGYLVKRAAQEASRPGLLDALVNRFSLQTAGELVCGVIYSFNGGLFKLYPAIIAAGVAVSSFALIPGLAGEPNIPFRNAVVVTLLIFLPFFGVASWKAGEAGNFILLFSPLLFIYFFGNLFAALRLDYTSPRWRTVVLTALVPAVLALGWTVPWARVQALTTSDELPLKPAEQRLVDWLQKEVEPGTIWFVSSDAYQFNPSYFVPGMKLEYHDIATDLGWMKYRCRTYVACYAVFHRHERGGERLGLTPVFTDFSEEGYAVFPVGEKPCAE